MYTLIMIVAIAVGAYACKRTQQALPLNGLEKFTLGLGAFCGAMLGAKLPFVFYDREGLLSGAAWFANGKTIMCGLVGGYLGVELTKWALDIRTKTGDSFVVPVALAVGIGRLACFVGGCCYGTPTNLPWGTVFPTVDNLARHPTQLYEAIFHLTAAGVLLWFRARHWFPGQLAKLYIISYAFYRFGTEYIRPEPHWVAGWTAYQWAALAIVPLFAFLWWRDRQTLLRGISA